MTSVPFSSSLSRDIGVYGYACTFVLGVIGHTCSLVTFGQRQLRSTSTSFLFLNITVFDICYLLMSLYDFFLINLALPLTSPDYIVLCRFRTFILNFVQTTSSWLLVCVAVDRLVRARMPHRTKKWCTKTNAALASLLTVVCSVTLNSHVLQAAFTTAFPFTRVICGPSRANVTDYSTFYYFTWPFLQTCFNILLPALLMVICLIGIYRKVRNTAAVRRHQHLQSQILLMMLSKVGLFLICTLPHSVYRIAVITSIDQTKAVQYSIFLFVTAILTILLNANYSLAFYVHCLTSTLFRQTFIKTMKNCVKRANTIHPVAHTLGPVP